MHCFIFFQRLTLKCARQNARYSRNSARERDPSTAYRAAELEADETGHEGVHDTFTVLAVASAHHVVLGARPEERSLLSEWHSAIAHA